MKNLFVAIAAASLLLSSATALFADEFDQITTAVEAIEGRSADFRQTFRTHGSDNMIEESGVVTFGTLPRMRWSYESPEEKVFVFDGETSWLYIPMDRQVSVHRLTDSERAQLPFLLLRDEAGTRKNFKISTSTRNAMETISLEPRETAQIRSLVISVDPKSHQIRAIEYEDVEGNRTRFEFSNYRTSTAGASTFRFEAPAGVDVVEY